VNFPLVNIDNNKNFLVANFIAQGSNSSSTQSTTALSVRHTSSALICLWICACDRDAIWTSPASGGRAAGPSTGSLSSSVGKIGSDDDQSLNDYASLTPGKFTEDGSFIGEYNPTMKYKSSQRNDSHA